MQDLDTNWKAAAEAARGDLPTMLDVCKGVSQSKTATLEQLEAAKAARRSLFTAIRRESDVRIDVVKIRFERLLRLL